MKSHMQAGRQKMKQIDPEHEVSVKREHEASVKLSMSLCMSLCIRAKANQ